MPATPESYPHRAAAVNKCLSHKMLLRADADRGPSDNTFWTNADNTFWAKKCMSSHLSGFPVASVDLFGSFVSAARCSRTLFSHEPNTPTISIIRAAKNLSVL